MKILIAGYGSIGRRHLNNLRALGETDLLLLRSHRSTLPDNEISDIPVETTIQAALAHQPQAVVVANPTAMHLDVAIPAALAGCSILMEKPISHSLARLDELQAALAKGGGDFLTAFQYRFHPGLRQIHQCIQEQKAGTIVSVQSHWGEYLPGWHPWEDYRASYSARADLGGGVVNTLCHPFDYLRWMFGDAESVYAKTSNHGLNLPVEDNAEVLLQYLSGVSASVHLDYLQRPAQHDLRIIGTASTLYWSNADGIARYYQPETQNWEEALPPAGFERNTLFTDEMAHFLRVARKEEAPQCTLEDGSAILQLTQAVHRSAREGCLVKF